MGIKAYATWAHADGRYADFVLAANRYNQDLSTRMLNGAGVTGGYHSYGFGASVEVGRMIEFGEEAKTSHWKNHWFIEPQAQLSYYHVKGRDFTMSNGMEVSQDNGDFLTGRLGLVLGKKFNDRNDPEGKRFSQVYARAGVNHEFMGRQKIDVNGVRFSDTLGGTRVYYGVGGDWQTGRNTRLYWQIEREHGSHYTKEFEASAGVKVEF